MNKIIITSAITIALHLSACSEQKTAEQLIVSANQYNQQGQFANAVIDFKNAVRLAPKNSDARLGLGKAYLKQGNYISAEKELERAINLGASYEQAASVLAQVKTRLDKFEDVEQLVKLSAELDDISYLTVLSYAGMSALANGQITKAQDYFSQAVSIDQGTLYARLAKAYLFYTEREFDKGLQVNTQLLTDHNEFAEALLLQGYLYFSLSQFKQASDAFEQYLVSSPQDQNIRFFLVNSLIKAGDFERADSLTNKLLASFKESPLALQYKAQIEYQAGNYTEAKAYASQAVGYNENFIIAKMIAGVSSYQLGELEQAYDYLISLESMLPPTAPMNIILLSIKIKLGLTDDLAISVAKLKALKNSDSDSDLLQVTSTELIKMGDYASAQSLVDKAAKVSPDNASILAQRGILLLNKKDLSGIKSLEKALRIDPSLHDTEFALAQQYIRGNEIAKAKAIANKWLQSDNNKISANIVLGLISMKQEDVAEAERYFQQALTIDPKSISALYNLAIVSAFNNNTLQAIDGFKEVLELNPNHHNAIRRYSVLQTREGNLPEAISFLNALHQHSKLSGNHVHKNLVIGLAQNLRMGKQIDTAINLLESIKMEDNLSARYWSVLADSYKQTRQFNKALTSYELGLKQIPKSYILYIGNIETLEVLQQYSQALSLTKVANEYFPNDIKVMTMLAYLELANNNVSATKQQLNLLKEKGITNNVITSIKAKVAIQDKQYLVAIELYSDLYEQVPNSNNVINLSRALQFSSQGSEAEFVLEDYLTKNTNDNRVRVLLAELYGMNNVDNIKSMKIIATYQNIIKQQPNNLAALNNLAWQQYQSNDLHNAQLNIEKALALAPTNTAILESYGVILVSNKHYEHAINVLTSVINKGSIDVSAKVGLAEAYIATNQYEQAQSVLSGLSAHDSKLNVKIARLKQETEQYLSTQ